MSFYLPYTRAWPLVWVNKKSCCYCTANIRIGLINHVLLNIRCMVSTSLYFYFEEINKCHLCLEDGCHFKLLENIILLNDSSLKQLFLIRTGVRALHTCGLVKNFGFHYCSIFLCL